MSHAGERDELADDLTALGPVIYHRILRRLADAPAQKDAELTIPQRLALMAIAEAEERTVTQVAQRTGVAHSTATRMVHGLVRRGFVREAQATAGDRRRRLVSLTEPGREALARATGQAYARAARLVAPLDASTRIELQRGLQILLALLRDDEAAVVHRVDTDAAGSPTGG